MKRALIAGVAALLFATAAEARERRQTVASWYGAGFHGRLMANGERFDKRKPVVAHRTLTLGTKIRVCNRENGKCAVATVKDRGPYHKGRPRMMNRGLDLSEGLARRLDFIKEGTAPVTYRVLHKPKKPVTYHRRTRR